MELSKEVHDQEPIILDLSMLDEKQTEDKLSRQFNLGRLTFGDELKDCVAAGGGITETGYLDLVMLEGLRQTSEYLEGRQGQPVVMADTVVRQQEGIDNHIVIFSGYIGTLANETKLIGMKEIGSSMNMHPGISVTKGFFGFKIVETSSDFYTDSLYKDEGDVLPVFPIRPQRTWGDYADRKREIVAGTDIVPWILETFGDGINGYSVYMNVVYALTRNPGYEFNALKPLLDGPFLDIAKQEHKFHSQLEETLLTFQAKDWAIKKIAEGNIGQTNLALMEAIETYPYFRGRLPRTSSGSAAESVDKPGAPKISSRLEAVAREKDPLTKLLAEAQRNQ